MASHTSKSIRDLLKHVDYDELVLPEVQRDFVWTPPSVLKLSDSLSRAMPIGRILVWRARQAVDAKAFSSNSKPLPGRPSSFTRSA